MLLRFFSLGDLLAAHPIPLLGEISFAVERDVKKIRQGGDIHKVWENYDKVFSERPDYRLWRKQERFKYNSSILESWPAIPALVEDGLESRVPEIVWGTMVIFSGDLAGPRLAPFSNEQATLLTATALFRLHSSLPPVPTSERECALVKLFLIAAAEKYYFKNHLHPTAETIGDYLKKLKSSLIELDANWRPGMPLYYHVLSGRNREGNERSLLPFSLFHVMHIVQQIMYDASVTIHKSLSVLSVFDENALTLINTDFLYALSAWKTLRSVRKGIEKSGNYSNKDMERLSYDEYKTLLRCTKTARDNGDPLQSARMGHLLMRVIPDSIRSKTDFIKIGRDLCFMVRQAGLEVDGRFLKDRSEFIDQRKKRIAALHLAPAMGKCGLPAEPHNICNPNHSVIVDSMETSGTIDAACRTTKPQLDPYTKRCQLDMRNLPEWETLLSMFPNVTNSQDLLSIAVVEATACSVQSEREYKQTDQKFLSSTFHLCNRYGLLLHAASVLLNTHYRPSKSDFMDFAHNVNRATKNLPFGIDHDTQGYWQMALRKKCMEVNDRETLTFMDILLIHELVLGRSLTNILGSGDEGARLLTKKYCGDLDEDDIRGALDLDRASKVYGQSTIKATELATFIQSAGGSAFQPVCASIVSMSNSRTSLVVINPSGHISWKLIPKEGLHDYAEHLMGFMPPSISEITSGGPLLPWGEFFSLCKIIHEEADRVAPGYSWLMLSVDPILARLPWQDLFRSSAPRKNIVVSLTPSLSWAAMNYKRKSPTPLREMRNWLSSDPKLTDTRKEMLNTLQRACLPASSSLFVILGHGLIGKNDMPAIKVDGIEDGMQLSTDDWILVSEYKIVILHSCHTGFMPSNSTGDFSGVAGLLLGLGCRVICAPVTEVSQRCALVLQKHLMHAEGLKEVGARYLSAVREDPEVALYNIYGFADEPIRK